jgi:O-acetyl-ADP-ribose deacetylase (regulator of RNase III)
MTIRYVEGDIFAGPERVLVHGCNAFGKMSAGLALQVRRLYPEAFRAYRAAFESPDDRQAGLPLGSATWVRGADGRLIVNAVTQRDYGRAKGRVCVDYEAVRTVLRTIDERARSDGFESVAFPPIGAGLAGGSWTILSQIIEAQARAFEPVVYLLDGTRPAP